VVQVLRSDGVPDDRDAQVTAALPATPDTLAGYGIPVVEPVGPGSGYYLIDQLTDGESYIICVSVPGYEKACTAQPVKVPPPGIVVLTVKKK